MLTDEVRKITRNRQPGRCCVEGCQVPAAPVVVAMPQIGSAPARSLLPLRRRHDELGRSVRLRSERSFLLVVDVQAQLAPRVDGGGQSLRSARR